MKKSLFREEVFSSILLFGVLLIVTILVDLLLHTIKLVWIGRYLGYAGTFLIIASFAYSLRKRKIIQWGSPRLFLIFHEYASWIGSLMVMVHAGIHFNAFLPWFATSACLVVVASGLTGKFLLRKAQAFVSLKRAAFLEQGTSDALIEEKIFWDAVALDVMGKWRTPHIQITVVFCSLAALHILTIFMLWK